MLVYYDFNEGHQPKESIFIVHHTELFFVYSIYVSKFNVLGNYVQCITFTLRILFGSWS
jgi:hypothetical protein